MLEFLELRQPGQPEIGNAHASGDATFRLAIRSPEIGRPRRAERHAVADVQILESTEQRDGLELQIGDDRRPAPSGVAPLDAVKTQLPEFRQQLQHVKTRAADLVAPQVQFFELRQRGQMLQPHVGDLREADVERFQAREPGDVREARVGHVGSPQVQRFQLAVSTQKRHGRIGDELGREQIQLFQLIERSQALCAAVRNVGQRQIQPLQTLEGHDPFDVGIGRPRASQRDVDDAPGLIAEHATSLHFDRPNDIGFLRLRFRGVQSAAVRGVRLQADRAGPAEAGHCMQLSEWNGQRKDRQDREHLPQLLRSRLVESRSY